MKIRVNLTSILLMIGILLCSKANSQNADGVTITVGSKIPDTITERARLLINLNVQNLSAKNIKLYPALILHVDYSVLKRKGDHYICIDSNCIFLPQPIYPGKNYKRELKSGEQIKIPMSFPPGCSLFENEGDYKVKYLFTYQSGKQSYTVETKWYQYTCMFPPLPE